MGPLSCKTFTASSLCVADIAVCASPTPAIGRDSTVRADAAKVLRQFEGPFFQVFLTNAPNARPVHLWTWVNMSRATDLEYFDQARDNITAAFSAFGGSAELGTLDPIPPFLQTADFGIESWRLGSTSVFLKQNLQEYMAFLTMLRFHALLDVNAAWPSCEGGSRNGTICTVGCSPGYVGGLTTTCNRGSWSVPVGCCQPANETNISGTTCPNAAINGSILTVNTSSTPPPPPSQIVQGMSCLQALVRGLEDA